MLPEGGGVVGLADIEAQERYSHSDSFSFLFNEFFSSSYFLPFFLHLLFKASISCSIFEYSTVRSQRTCCCSLSVDLSLEVSFLECLSVRLSFLSIWI